MNVREQQIEAAAEIVRLRAELRAAEDRYDAPPLIASLT